MIYGSSDMEHDRHNFLSFWTIFCPFTPLWTQKIKILKKIGKNTWRYYHFTNINESYDLWFLRYKVQQTEFFVILEHFLPFYPPNNLKIKIWKNEKPTSRHYHFTHVHHKFQSHDAWFLRYGAWRTELFVILGHFLHFYPSNNPKNHNFKKLRKTPGDNIVLQMCTINDNHMMYGSWDMKRDGQNFLSFWIVFCPFTLITTWKTKILKKWKKCLEILSFYTSVP